MVVFLLVVSFVGAIYTRKEKRACRGVELNSSRCEKCKTFIIKRLQIEFSTFLCLYIQNGLNFFVLTAR